MGVEQGNVSKALLKHRQIPSTYLRKQTHSAWGGMHFKQVGPKFCLPSIQSNWKDPGKNPEGDSNSDLGDSCLANPGMVPQSYQK